MQKDKHNKHLLKCNIPVRKLCNPEGWPQEDRNMICYNGLPASEAIMDPFQKTKRLRTEQKPVSLMTTLLNIFTCESEWCILDLCSGTGSMAEAVLQMQDFAWTYWGIDQVRLQFDCCHIIILFHNLEW